ncbi:MAG: rhomboid family intramembrane serine protease [Mucilaginibacter polytrichastri]|nr:rhomboid family intramembrane serine protease [Mucilaginibacter polytrichastri]
MMTTASPVTFVLLSVIFATSLTACYNRTLFYTLILHPYSIRHKGEYYRLFTGDLVHNDRMHLAANLLTGWVFLSNLEELMRGRHDKGSYFFLVLYLLIMLAAASVVSWTRRDDFEFASAGCSGSITGCLFSYIVLDPHGHALNVAVIGEVENMYTGLVYLIGLTLFKWRCQNEYIHHDIHFYGALSGSVIALVSKIWI